MAWEKSPEELAERFGRVMDRYPDAERRKMFGYPAAFVGGNMVTGLHQRDWVVRLSEDQQTTARAAGAASFEPMPGRPMKNFVALPATVIADDDAVGQWVERAIAHGKTLPPKRRVMTDDLDPRETERARRRDREAAAEQRALMRPGMGKVFKQIQDTQAKAAKLPLKRRPAKSAGKPGGKPRSKPGG